MTAELKFVFKFLYKCNFENGLIEHELDHVFIGQTDDTPHINKDEAMAFSWMSIKFLKLIWRKIPTTTPFGLNSLFKIIENHLTPISNESM